MARELQLDRELLFTVRPDAPIRLCRGQVSASDFSQAVGVSHA